MPVPHIAKYDKVHNMPDGEIKTNEIADGAVTPEKLSETLNISNTNMNISRRTLTILPTDSSVITTNISDQYGIILGVYFSSSTPDATCTEITSVRFKESAGRLIVTANADATLPTIVVVDILLP